MDFALLMPEANDEIFKNNYRYKFNFIILGYLYIKYFGNFKNVLLSF